MMHGQFLHSINEKLMDQEQLYQWLKLGEIESTIVAVQDQAISTKYFKKKILK